MPADKLRELLIRHEGIRLKAYECPAGFTTIGVGRNLDTTGISREEAMLLLTNDMQRINKEIVTVIPWINSLDVVRQDVVLSMVFNMGISRFAEFKKFIEALSLSDYKKAAFEMENSRWAKQVPSRVAELCRMMLTGKYPSDLGL